MKPVAERYAFGKSETYHVPSHAVCFAFAIVLCRMFDQWLPDIGEPRCFEEPALCRCSDLMQCPQQDPELAARFRMPAGHPSHQGLVNLARAMLEQATANKDLLVSSGMSATLLDDLSSALAELEKTLEESRAGRVDHVGASAEMKSVAQDISAQVRLLHGLVRYRFRNTRICWARGPACGTWSVRSGRTRR